MDNTLEIEPVIVENKDVGGCVCDSCECDDCDCDEIIEESQGEGDCTDNGEVLVHPTEEEEEEEEEEEDEEADPTYVPFEYKKKNEKYTITVLNPPGIIIKEWEEMLSKYIFNFINENPL